MGTGNVFIKHLKNEGVTSIELRHRDKGLSLNEMRTAAELVWEHGLKLTIHGEALPEPSSFDFSKLFLWADIVNKILKMDLHSIIVTLHPLIIKDNEVLSAKLTSEILTTITNVTEFPSYTYALENQRSKGYIDPAVTFEGVVQIVSKIPDKKIGICWDMGHSYSNVINYNHPLFPPREFLERVIHTHIHDLGPDGRTHWPFKKNIVPLEENIRLLQSYKYTGTYNMELSFNRFAEETDIKNLVLKSIRNLRKLIG